MLFIMSNQIIINTLKSVITINNKYDVNFSSLRRSTAFLCQLTEFYFLEIPFKYQYPRILLIIQNFQLSLISNSQKTVQNHQLSKMTNQHLHYLIPWNFLYSLKEIIPLLKFEIHITMRTSRLENQSQTNSSPQWYYKPLLRDKSWPTKSVTLTTTKTT